MGRWLGVSHRVGTLMSYWVLTDKCTIISRTTVQRITQLEAQVDDNIARSKEFDEEIKRRLNEDDYPVDGDKTNPAEWAEYLGEDIYDKDFLEEFDFVVDNNEVKEADETFTPDVFDDTYLRMELALPGQDGEQQYAKVTKHLKDKDGLPIGTANDNPILDTRMYEVEYIDGHKASLTANAIAQNLFAQVDEEGNRHVLLDEIIDHRKDSTAVAKEDTFITTKSGTKRCKETTKGWDLLMRWKDGSSTWVHLKDMKEEFSVQVAEYAVMAMISPKPTFA